MSEQQQRNEVADYAQKLHARAWVANHDGNVSLRLGNGRYLSTATALSKARVSRDNLLIVDEAGARIAGNGKPFSEIGLHLAVYRRRPDVHAVIHAHPPTATGFAVAGQELFSTMLAEAVVSLGPSLPTVPLAAPGAASAQALEPYLADHDALLLANHGVLTFGQDLEQAFLRMELVEHLARIAVVATQLGGVKTLPASAIPPLLEARARAGLGPRTRTTSTAPNKPTVVACAPPPPGATVEVYERKRDLDLVSIIQDEIRKSLKSG